MITGILTIENTNYAHGLLALWKNTRENFGQLGHLPVVYLIAFIFPSWIQFPIFCKQQHFHSWTGLGNIEVVLGAILLGFDGNTLEKLGPYPGLEMMRQFRLGCNGLVWGREVVCLIAHHWWQGKHIPLGNQCLYDPLQSFVWDFQSSLPPVCAIIRKFPWSGDHLL